MQFTRGLSKMIDCFLADVISYNALEKKAKVMPLVILKDGTELSNLPIEVKTVSGIKPSIGDTVLIVTSRNNLDDKSISIYFDPSWSNGRLIGIVSTNGSYTLKGNYVFESNVTFESDVTVKGNLTVEGESTFEDVATFEEDAYFEKDAFFGITEISFLNHKHTNNAPAPGLTGLPQ